MSEIIDSLGFTASLSPIASATYSTYQLSANKGQLVPTVQATPKMMANGQPQTLNYNPMAN